MTGPTCLQYHFTALALFCGTWWPLYYHEPDVVPGLGAATVGAPGCPCIPRAIVLYLPMLPDEIEMADSTASVIPKDRAGVLSAREQILALARSRRIAYLPNAVDDLGNAITQLAGDDVRFDDTELLLLALERAGCVSTGEADRLHIAHMRQRAP
jgi:hypothetical protein